MKIELKNIKINLTFSEETIMFMADLAINGVIVGEAENDGRGGCTFYGAKGYDVKKQEFLSDEIRQRNRDIISQAEIFCKNLPKTKYDFGLGEMEMEQTLESVIDDLVSAEINKKEQKKLEKKMVDHIMWGKPNGATYSLVKFKIPLKQIPPNTLQAYIDKYREKFKEGEVFLNTNLEELGIKI
jgi:hypothetical protein